MNNLKINLIKGIFVLFTSILSINLALANPYNQGKATDNPEFFELVFENIVINSSATSLSDMLLFAGENVPFDKNHVYDKFKGNLNIRMTRAFVGNLMLGAETWFPVIEPILAEYGIPEDFKFLPAIESSFKANARSRAGAVGFWQFMPATARAYGLTVNKKRDDRLDIKKSTVAACKYLNALYERLGSWTLVAAAYNVGEGAMERAMIRQQKDDYFSLKLNSETANYVYKLLTFKYIYMHANFAESLLARVDNMDKLPTIGVKKIAMSHSKYSSREGNYVVNISDKAVTSINFHLEEVKPIKYEWQNTEEVRKKTVQGFAQNIKKINFFKK